MPAAFWIAHVRVTDEAAYAEYAKRAPAAIEAHGGKFLARGGKYEILEGADRARHVVAQFPSLEAAHDCYHSPAYQEALSFAVNAAERDLMIVEALE